MDARYYVYHHEQQTGPLTAEELRALFAREGLGADVYVCREGDADWSRAGDMAELGDFVASPPPAAAEEAPSADVHAAVPATSGEPETIAAAADGTERAAAAEPLPAASASGAATAAGAVSTAPASMRGFRRRLLKWGTVAAGILLTVGAVGGAAFYYHTHRTTDFATLVGFDTSTYYECNLNNITEREVRQISEALAYAGKKLDFAPPELLVHKLGIRCAYAACGPAPSTEDNPPPLLVALEVHNLQETLKLFRRLQERAKKETESRGGDADNERTQREFSDWELDEGNKPCYIGLANKGNILLISTDADILENAINRYEGNDRSPSLADNPQYREAVAARPAQADFFSYSDLPRMLKEQEARLSVLFREQPALLELKKKYIDPLRTSYGYGIRDGEYACMESVMLLAEDCRWAQTLADARCEFPPQSEAHNLFRLSVALPRGWSQPVSTKLQELVDNRHRQKLMECQGALGALHSALYLYQTDVGRFPDRLEQLERDRAPGWSGPYLARQILDPWGGTISYQSDGYDYAAVVLYAEEPLAWYASDVDRLIFAEDAEERIRRADQPIDVAQRLDQVRELAFHAAPAGEAQRSGCAVPVARRQCRRGQADAEGSVTPAGDARGHPAGAGKLAAGGQFPAPARQHGQGAACRERRQRHASADADELCAGTARPAAGAAPAQHQVQR